MEIQGAGNAPRLNKLSDAKRTVGSSGVEQGNAPSMDAVEISEMAQFLSKLSRVPDLRKARVEEIRGLVERGEFVTKEKLHTALSRLFDEIWDEG